MHTLIKDKNASNKTQTVIGLLRHGKTVWNEEKRIQGRKNSPLSPGGIAQVHEWGKFLGGHSIDRIISSDLGRVKETVNIIQQYSQNVPVEYTSALREQSWGDWEGLTFADLQRDHAQELAKQVASGWNFRPPGGESRTEVLSRALPVIKEAVRNFPGEQILLVSHEGIVKSVIYHLAHRAFMPDEKKIIQKRQFHLLLTEKEELALGPLNIFPNTNQK